MPYSDMQILCDDIFEAGTDYVYFQHSRFSSSNSTELRGVLEELTHFIRFITGPCGEVADMLICYYLLTPCGRNNLVHVPLSICPEVCEHVSTELCSSEWELAEILIVSRYGEQYALPNCSRPGNYLEFLNLSSDCCTNGGVILPG